MRGRVLDETTSQPLEFVSVYLNTTTIGTLTNEKGEFTIPVRAGRYELIVSMVGYEPIIYPIETSRLPSAYVFKLSQQNHTLNSIQVKAKRGKEWYDNLEVFKENFLGRGELARGSKLKNPEVLIIDYNRSQGTLKVSATDLIQIENPALGYQISYLLVAFEFIIPERYVSYLGYPRYEPMTGNARRQRRWERNRLIAYQGSTMHFVRSLRQQRLEEEGYNLRRLHRSPNPDRPSDEELEEARKQLRAGGGWDMVPEHDPLRQVLSKSNLPKMIERLDTTQVPYQDYLRKDSSSVTMAFDGYFQVVYTGEKEEWDYVTSSFQRRIPTFQTSVLSLHSNSVILDELGEFIEPLNVFVEGYWSWEKVAHSLPYDYLPR
ncbi:carboxypeptidase-like regulatory domain-containing protein [Telluribacter sp.]|uniref:carboxypeptidase-like regulatory domain-containing protein n=1 Tax=Telluribacter sp. TaxID=1978767 RepID=UPI002E14DBE6|nr:carboxypeptidase-like regulatory domain-containing protein [Telluribacter sp.]